MSQNGTNITIFTSKIYIAKNTMQNIFNKNQDIKQNTSDNRV